MFFNLSSLLNICSTKAPVEVLTIKTGAQDPTLFLIRLGPLFRQRLDKRIFISVGLQYMLIYSVTFGPRHEKTYLQGFMMRSY